MIQQIGYPPFITNLTSLEQYFSGVSDFKLCTFVIRVHLPIFGNNWSL